MSKRTIVITIDAGKERCGKCRCYHYDKGYNCDAFAVMLFSAANERLRCPACIAAEHKAKCKP